MINKTGNILLLLGLLSLLLFGNLTYSRTYQSADRKPHKEIMNIQNELYSLDLTGKDFLIGNRSKEFEIITDSDYTYSGFRSMILILSGLILLMILIQLSNRSILWNSVLYTMLLIPAFFIGVYIAQYPNFFYELSLAKFPGIGKIIDSKTPALSTIQSLAFIGLIFNWGGYLINKKSITMAKKS